MSENDLAFNIFLLFGASILVLGGGRYTFLAWTQPETLRAEMRATKTLFPEYYASNYFIDVARFIAPFFVILGGCQIIYAVSHILSFTIEKLGLQ